MAEPVALFETRAARNGAHVGRATLNAPRALNALSLEMVEALLARLDAWRDNPQVACIVLQGAGERAFCAGGDIVALYHALVRDDAASRRQVETFFTREYTLDYRLHTCPKPVLCWGHGIVMGGGLGLLMGSSHRVVTETSRVATPEIAIGLYPDVASSWFLPRMPGRTGLFMGVTGVHLNAADALYTGLADHYLENADRETLYAQLLALDWSGTPRQDHAVLSALLRGYRGRHALPDSPVRAHFDAINEITDHDSVEAIQAALEARAPGDAWLERAAENLRRGSPTSAKLAFALYRRAARLSLKEVFALELGVTVQVTRHPDFREGVRARVIDKDNRPRWSPATLADVSEDYIDEHLASPWPSGRHPFADW